MMTPLGNGKKYRIKRGPWEMDKYLNISINMIFFMIVPCKPENSKMKYAGKVFQKNEHFDYALTF